MCEWPKEEPKQLGGMKNDLMAILHDWVTCKPIRFWVFPPWPAAMLASQSELLASTYVTELFETGLLQPCTIKYKWLSVTFGEICSYGEREFAERVATLILQTENVEHVLGPALAKLDFHLQQTYFNIKHHQ
ncbi:hypothetical protein PsorP6_013675 [Peronosclerospora sorghi]|uniref:Uncharacterized protein n=1 Tax=Peronosclerospora sorghi TaxID=230839 RepID=A0ACC0VJQ0_9STRA|nr:hypothetical protein PsorP6_013675 [Peronosclerospora sorghi]